MKKLKFRDVPPFVQWSLLLLLIVALISLVFLANLVYSNTIGSRMISARVLHFAGDYAITDQGQFELYGAAKRNWRGLRRTDLLEKIRFGCKYELIVSTDLFQDSGFMFGHRFPFLHSVKQGIEENSENCRELFKGD